MDQPKSGANTIITILLTIIITIGLLFLGAFAFWYFQKSFSAQPSPSPEQVASAKPIPTAKPDIKPSAEPLTSAEGKSDLQMIREAFAEKYSRPVDEVNVNISKQSNPYASGGVNFSGEMGGGWFLAYKQSDDKWIIVADGNGTIPCEAIDPYAFPTDMAPECWRESTGEIETR